MTPQPQPAAYWIDLLEELTGGIPFQYKVKKSDRYVNLASFIQDVWIIDDDFCPLFYNAFYLEAHYVSYGKNVIDAAVEFYDQRPKNGKQNMSKAFCAVDNLDKQTSLYLRCNGIKR